MRTVLNFKDKDTFRKLERQAYDGTIDVTKFPPEEYKYFSELKKLYYAFKFEGLSKEDASRKKQILFRNYQENISEHEHRLMVYPFQETAALRATVGLVFEVIIIAGINVRLKCVSVLFALQSCSVLKFEQFLHRRTKKFCNVHCEL